MTTNHLNQVSAAKVRAALIAESAGQPLRKATVRVRGIAVTIDCPPWCVTDHSAENLVFLEDLSHYGAPIALTVPMYGGGTEKVLVAHLALWPFDGQGTYLALDADNSGEMTNLFEPAALAFADQLVAHAERIRAEVAQMSGGRKKFTLAYETGDGPQSRTLPAKGVETVGKVVQSMAARGEAWNIKVCDDSGNDVTFDFACFAEDNR